MRKLFSAILLLLTSIGAQAQHTFSMVAIDSLTGEIGSAGATCLSVYPMGSLLNRIVPGKGAINAQSYVSEVNRDYAASLIQKGYTATQINDSLYYHDEQATPGYRQNLIITMKGKKVIGAGFTGEFAMDYANHIVGPNYVIAGNILAGQHVLDSMDNAFKRTKGSLADKLMAALMAAKFPGADARCATTSSLAAFIRLAKPTDGIENYTLNLNVSSPENNPFEPIDSLYARFQEFKALGMEGYSPHYGFALYPNPAENILNLTFDSPYFSGPVKIQISDCTGRVYIQEILEKNRATSLDISTLNAGVYIVNAGTGRMKFVKF
jgi:uncharacterized Ntn-hydrolase superfamily protein